jgi:hypothetical protein
LLAPLLVRNPHIEIYHLLFTALSDTKQLLYATLLSKSTTSSTTSSSPHFLTPSNCELKKFFDEQGTKPTTCNSSPTSLRPVSPRGELIQLPQLHCSCWSSTPDIAAGNVAYKPADLRSRTSLDTSCRDCLSFTNTLALLLAAVQCHN